MCDWSSSVGLEKRLSTLETNSLSLSTPTPFPRGVSQPCIPAQTRTPTFPRATFPITECIFCPLSKQLCNSPSPHAVPCLLRGAWFHALCHAGVWHCLQSPETSRRGRKALPVPPRAPRCPLAGEGTAGARGRGALSLSPKSHAQPVGLGCSPGAFYLPAQRAGS